MPVLRYVICLCLISISFGVSAQTTPGDALLAFEEGESAKPILLVMVEEGDQNYVETLEYHNEEATFFFYESTKVDEVLSKIRERRAASDEHPLDVDIGDLIVQLPIVGGLTIGRLTDRSFVQLVHHDHYHSYPMNLSKTEADLPKEMVDEIEQQGLSCFDKLSGGVLGYRSRVFLTFCEQL